MAGVCTTCEAVGVTLLGPHQFRPEKTSSKQHNTSFLMGNNEYSKDFEGAADIIMERHFKNICRLKDTTETDFKHGLIGKCKIPSLVLSEIPTIVEPNDFSKVVSMKELPKSNMAHVNM